MQVCVYNHFSRGFSGRQNKPSPSLHGEGRGQTYEQTNKLISNSDRGSEGNRAGEGGVSTRVWLESILDGAGPSSL